MELSLDLGDGLALTIADQANGHGHDGGGFPTRRLARGLLLSLDGRDLAEEGVGFGVPVLKQGARTIFPGAVELAAASGDPVRELTATFTLNLIERLATRDGGSLASRPLYAAKDSLAALHRHAPSLRRPLTATSAALRRTFGWTTTYAETGCVGSVTVRYAADAARQGVEIDVDLDALPRGGLTGVVLMNELGARLFDRYRDSDGTELQGAAIGTWDEVTASEAAFESTASGVSFALPRIAGARLHRGRELIGGRLAWAGFGYSLPPSPRRFAYDVRFAGTT